MTRSPGAAAASRQDPLPFLRESLAAVLKTDLTRTGDEVPLVDLGLDSILCLVWLRRIDRTLDLPLSVAQVCEHPTLGELAALIRGADGEHMPATPHRTRATQDVAAYVRRSLAAELELDESELDDQAPFVELGLDSITGVTWTRRLNTHFRLSLSSTQIYSRPTIEELTDYLVECLDGEDAAPAEEPNVETVEDPGPVGERDVLASWLRASLAAELELDESELDDQAPFVELGLDSITGVTWTRSINTRFGLALTATTVYSHPTIRELAEYLAREQRVEGVAPEPEPTASDTASAVMDGVPEAPDATGAPHAVGTRGPAGAPTDIAIVGMSGAFPQAEDLDGFWRNVMDGRDCVSEVPDSRWPVGDYYDERPGTPGRSYSRWMGVLENADLFDPLFFGISPNEAEYMDPQQRVLLQESWRCVEEAGYSPEAFSGSRCGVFMGASVNGYGGWTDETDLSAHQNLGTNSAILASRISYVLNLKGPCLSIDTSCSSSLVAIANACDSLVLGSSDAALAGGVWVIPGPGVHVAMSQLRALSPDGRCFAFDERANGFVPAEGVGVLLLKRLADAEADGDRIHAVIRGWGVNQDGRSNGITAPNAEAQAALLSHVYESFGLDADDIELVEAHGTGTELGDPVEVDGLVQSFGAYTDRRGYCALGSVKSNIGHTACAAGVAGTIKSVLALEHGVLPPTIHHERTNHHIDLSDTPFYVNDRARPWSTRGKPRMAAVSSFGYSGTNAHLVLAEAPAVVAPTRPAGARLIVLSGRSAERLREQAEQLLAHLETHPGESLRGVSHTLLMGRKHFRHRLALVARTTERAALGLRHWLDGSDVSTVRTGDRRPDTSVPVRAPRSADGGEQVDAAVLDTLAEQFVRGRRLAHDGLFDEGGPERITLPTYPFARESYWLPYTSPARRDDGPDRDAPGDGSGEPDRGELLWLEPTWRDAPTDGTGSRDAAADLSGHDVWVIGRLDGPTENSLRGLLPEGVRLRVIDPGELDTGFPRLTRALLESVREGVARGGTSLLQVVVLSDGASPVAAFTGVSGLLRTAELEHSGLRAQCVEYLDDPTADALAETVRAFRRDPTEPDVRRVSGRHQVRRLVEVEWEPEGAAPEPWRDGGVHVITGGLGGLGLVFAEEMADSLREGTIVLAGRSAPDVERRRRIASLERPGLTVEYHRVDVADRRAVEDLVAEAVRRHGAVHGVIHAAGETRDGLIGTKSDEDVDRVLAPKVAGLLHLDEATRDQPLDYLVAFSSNAAVLGSLGQADYAAANAFMDAYVGHRDRLVARGLRSGRSLTVNWPLWSEGGMRVDEAGLTGLRRLGVTPMRTEDGLRSFRALAAGGRRQTLVLAGDRELLLERMEARLGTEADEHVPDPGEADAPGRAEHADPRAGTLEALVTHVSEQLGVPAEELDPDEELGEFGFDSISLTTLANRLNDEYGLELAPTVFFEHRTLASVAAHLVDAYGGRLAPAPEGRPAGPAEPVVAPVAVPRPAPGPPVPARSLEPSAAAPVAIIGMSGSFPGAGDLAEFWENLREGKDCITEIPSQRWDWRAVDADSDAPAGRRPVRWGGFIDDVDRFDPLFFGISPREAAVMDPQQRLLLTHAWKALEDAGYAPSSLAGSDTAVLVGTAPSGYGELVLRERQGEDAHSATGVSGSIGPNRLSYLLDLHGPSEPIETACSSSLVAVHRGVELLRQGRSRMALVGGVNTMVSPDLHISYSRAGMLCEDGRCKTFSAHANGYVRGEGVGLLVLKPLDQAERDGDHVHAVIRGSAENHGGRAHSLTAPNPVAQAELLRSAYRQAGVDPRTVTYVEAHGTGTELGDPIELDALRAAFASLREEVPASTEAPTSCWLGSVKSNIGHLELAAGVAGLVKTVLQMRHGTLVESLHAQELNPHLKLGDGPFQIVRERRLWDRPRDVEGREIPRRAGVSSFGFGGVNAHVVLEEHQPRTPRERGTDPEAIPETIVLSARTEERLCEQARGLMRYLDEHRPDRRELADVAHTLRVGRDAMEERIAARVGSTDDLRRRLASFVEGSAEGWHRGSVTRRTAGSSTGEDPSPAGPPVTDDPERFLSEWVRGETVDRPLPPPTVTSPRRTSLPTYPFAGERYWVGGGSRVEPPAPADTGGSHPLVHRSEPGGDESLYSASFDGQEPFLRDHVVQGGGVLPGAAQLEMAREAVSRALGAEGPAHVRLDGVVWLRPAVCGPDGLDMRVSVRPRTADTWEYAIHVEAADGTRALCGQGRASLVEPTERRPLPLDEIRAACAGTSFSADQVYVRYARTGIDYGPAHRSLVRLDVATGEDGRPQVLAELSLPSSAEGADRYHLHPSVIDGALQATLGLGFPAEHGEGVAAEAALPFALQRLESVAGTPTRAYAWIRYRKDGGSDASSSGIDVTVCDEHGRVCAELRGLALRALRGAGAGAGAGDRTERGDLLLVRPLWEDAPADGRGSAVAAPEVDEHHVVIIGHPDGPSREALARALPEPADTTFVVPGPGAADARYTNAVQHVLGRLRDLLGRASRPSALLQVVLVGGAEPDSGHATGLSGLSGLLRTAHLENPHLRTQYVDCSDGADPALVADRLRREAARIGDPEVRYRGGRRQVRRLEPVDSPVASDSPWRKDGVYLITGGTGALGRIMADAIAAGTGRATVVLTSRSDLTEDDRGALERLRGAGLRVDHRRVDVSDRASVAGLLEYVADTHGTLTGVLHCAGVLRDGLVAGKSTEDAARVLAPKVSGLVHLDELSSEQPLDLFVCFSSTTAPLGNPGQADYAAANGFMDAYADHRARLVRSGRRHGRTLSVNWPLWEEGGMGTDAATRERLAGMDLTPLATEQGLYALRCGLAAEDNGLDEARLLVLSGNRDALLPRLTGTGSEGPVIPSRRPAPLPDADEAALADRVRRRLGRQLAVALRLDPGLLDDDTPLERYGLDSMVATELVSALEESFGPLPKTLFFEAQTVRALVEYLMDEHVETIRSVFGTPSGREPSGDTGTDRSGGAPTRERPAAVAEVGPRPDHGERRAPGRDDIAIIGVSGRYPHAEDLDEFWSNLRSGRDCVTEVPADRWKHDELYSPERGVPGRAYGRWGAFLDGVDRFDPLFFGISPREAEVMDPQQRLFLETAWRLLEGSGLTQERVERRYGRRVGVYVGSMYQMYQADEGDVVRSAMTSATSYNLIANRVSHAFGLEGPSLAVDSMCSSSLMAVHLACADLRRGESALAIAGGVNLTLHPNKYLSLSQAEMLGSHPGSRSFRDGDGYLPAEGVGAVLLKPLTEALRDGDTVHAVIRGSASLHGGGANQFMRPSYGTQVNVLRRALEQAEVEPESIGYVEAAANGASLSDLVEVRALREVFSGVTEPVALGSVKSNLGHPEAASGIAQLSKVVLQLRHAELAPLVEVGRANPDLGLEGGPLRLCEGPSSWEPRRSGGDEAEGAPPRRALINSVGAGGSYVSMVVEAPPETGDVSQEDHGDATERQLVVLSAKDTDRLRATARRLLDLTGDGGARPSLRDLAHTLQSGRDHLPERLAVVVDSLDELRTVLRRHLDTGPEDAGADARLHTGNAERDAGPMRAVVSGAAGEAFLSTLVADRDLDRLAALWTCGARIPWDGLHRGRVPRTLSLPTTAFQRGSYWVGRTWRPRPEGDGTARPVPGEPPVSPTRDEPSEEVDLRRYLESFFGEVLGLAPGDLPFDGDLQSVGADSILWVRLRRALDADLGLRLSAREIAESPTLERVLARLEDKRAERSETPTTPDVAEVAPSSAEPGADRVRAARTRALERFRRGEIGRDELKELMKKETTGA